MSDFNNTNDDAFEFDFDGNDTFAQVECRLTDEINSLRYEVEVNRMRELWFAGAVGALITTVIALIIYIVSIDISVMTHVDVAAVTPPAAPLDLTTPMTQEELAAHRAQSQLMPNVIGLLLAGGCGWFCWYIVNRYLQSRSSNNRNGIWL